MGRTMTNLQTMTLILVVGLHVQTVTSRRGDVLPEDDANVVGYSDYQEIYLSPENQEIRRAVRTDIPQGSASLAFVFDITGSMYDDLVQVIEGAAKILATTLARREKPLYDYVLVPFHDPEIGPVTVTTNPKKFQRDLRDLYVQGGGDCPEMSVGAIKAALQASLPNSFVYVFTDARAKDYHLTEQVLTLIQQKQSQVVFVMTGDCNNTAHPGYTAYEQIASTSSGQVFLLRKSQVNQILNFVRIAVQSQKVNLLSRDLLEQDIREIEVPIDSKLQDFTLSVSGFQPRVSVIDPDGRPVTKDNGLDELLKLKQALIVNVKDPKPGKWKFRVYANGPHTLRMTGLSGLDFIYGFSRKPTVNFNETGHRPIKGVPTHVLLNATELNYPGRFNKLELLSLDGKVISEVPLTYNPRNPSLYNVSSFMPPDGFFYLRVHGIDENGYELVRSTPTALSPNPPEKPSVRMEPLTRGYYDKTAVITCDVRSIVPFTVTWFREEQQLGNPLFFSDSANVTYSIPDASSFSEGTYFCNVSNVAGWSVAQTSLDVKDPPPSILRPQNASALPGNSALMTCQAFSTVPFNLTWYRARDMLNLAAIQRVNIFTNGSIEMTHVEKEDEGEYICRAANEGGYTEEKLHLIVQKAPIVSILPPVVNFATGDMLNVTCTSVAYPPPTYLWQRHGAILPITEAVSYDAYGHLVIKNAGRADEGEYECVARNVAGSGTGRVRLNYIETPIITVPEETVLVSNGATGVLRCDARGIPDPVVTWFKGDLEYKDLSFIEVDSRGELKILGVTEMDAGQYTCVATNPAGSTKANVNLQVGTSPVITKVPSSVGVEILNNVTLPCSAVGLPSPRITWSRVDGRELNFQGRFTVLRSGALRITGVLKEDEGMFTCTAKNQFGKDEASAFVSVTGIVPPLIAYSTPLIETRVGRTVRLTCMVLLGNPRPTVSWVKMGEKVFSSENVTVDGNGNLEIRNVQVFNEGEYTCVASNVGGNTTYVFTLDVQVPPEIKGTEKEFTVIQDHSVRLPCEVTGDPRPQIIWTKNGVRISEVDPHYFISEDGSMEIFSADPQDRATYSCTAINVAGVVEKRMILLVQIPPRIARDNQDYRVIVGSLIQLLCDAQGIPPPTITWKKDGQPIDLENLPAGVVYHPNGALRLESVTVEDGGVYECVATSIAGNDTKAIPLVVQVPPQILTEGPTEQVVLAGVDVVIDCDTSGDPPPTVRWRKDMREINFFDNTIKQMQKESGALIIPKAEISDTGRYVCIAENLAGVASRETVLIVHDPPRIPDSTPNSAKVIENQRVSLPCPASGTPAPTIVWYKDEYLLTGNELGVRLNTDGSLTLDSVEAEDAGRYHCEATNVAGNVSHFIDLEVYVPPRFSDDEGSGSVSGFDDGSPIIQNDTIRIRCPVNAIPPPQITWFKDGRELKIDSSNSDRITIRKDGKELIIRIADLPDTAKYTCVARNLAGESERNFEIDVLVPPTFNSGLLSPRNMSVIESQPVIIDCPAVGTPAPEITWYKDGYELYHEGDDNMRILSEGRRLEIAAAEVADRGNYSCVAINPAGSIKQEFELNVWIPPKIDESGDISSVEVIFRNSIILHCPASGLPVPEVSWYKDDVEITNNNSRVSVIENGWRLQIEDAQTEDTSRYSCQAKNIAGETEKFYDLNVLVPPKIDDSDIDKNPKIVQNRTMVLNCPTTGNPVPEIKWLRNGEPINANKWPNIQLFTGGRQLRINNAQVSDTASYRCVVLNKAGQDTLDFELEVHVPVTIPKDQLILDPKVIAHRSQLLDCPAEGVPPPKISWYKDGEELTTFDPNHMRILQDGHQLELLAAEVSDAGHYECRAINEAGSDNVIYDLEVYVPPSIIAETSSSANPQVIVNRTITINCFVTGIPKPKVEWLYHSRPLNLSSFNGRVRVMAEGRQLEIADAKVADSGRYTCIASNEAGVADEDFDLQVLVPPFIDTQNIELSKQVVKGRSVTLECPATGIPFPNITWYKDRDVVTEDGRIRIMSGGRSLEISFTQESDTSRYTCLASNIAGQDRQEYDLQVMVPPVIDDANLVDNPRVIVNRTVLLECPVDGVPPPKVQWLKNGEPLVPTSHLTLLANGRNLEILSAQEADTALYTCIASNSAGELRRTFDLEVLVPPSMPNATVVEEITVIEGRIVHIDCPVTGKPIPSIMWMKDNQPLDMLPDYGVKIRELSNGQQLEIRDTKVEDVGRYTCMATNVAGQIEKHYKVKVWVHPIIEGSQLPAEELSVVVRQPLEIKCVATGTPEPTMTWFKDGFELDFHEARHIRIHPGGHTLQIMGAQVEDAGKYTCSATNAAGKDTKLFKLDVYVPPKINDSLRVTEMAIKLGEAVTIECEASGLPPPTISWIREGEKISYRNANVRILDGGKKLQIVSAQLIDIGGYTCFASNVAGNATKEYSLKVLVPPTIDDGPSEVAATVNSRTILMCETLGLPDPLVTWQKDDVDIPSNGLRYRMHRSGSLEFSSVQIEDSGNYRCTATNDAGTATRVIELQVQVPPSIAHDGPLDKRVIAGEEVILPCEATGFPKPRITWQKGTQILLNTGNYEMLDSGSMKIKRAEVSDSGIYICLAQNNAGTTLGQVRLVVQVPPKIQAQQTEFTVIQDREVILPCRATGVPAPRITWEKDGQPISPGNLHYRYLRSGWLAIPMTRVDDSGSFTCVVENDAGKDSVSIDLVVQVPPLIRKGRSEITVSEGDVASLPCQSQGYPPPKISWIHDGKTMIHNSEKYTIEDSGMLVIKDIKEADGGSYVCTAVNKAGRDSREVRLWVQVPPTFTLVPQDQEVMANGRIELQCAAEGRPTPSITWRVNNTLYPTPRSVNGRSRLIIDNAMKSNDGTYMCVAENVAGSRKVIAAVRIKIPPRVLVPTGNQAVRRTEKVLLHCAVGGDPPPTIIWTKNGYPVSLSNRIQQMGNGSLIIFESTNEDAGEYTCVATNDAGSSEDTAQLVVRSPPNIIVEPQSVLAEMGDMIMMDCVAEGQPPPRIEWRKEAQILSSFDRMTIMPNNSLRIIASQLEDSGIYFCLARNNLGSVMSKAEIVVRVHGAWSPWSSWSLCSVSCGRGEQYRSRTCDNPSPAKGGRPCAGHSRETKICSPKECPVDGNWGAWQPWEPCTKTCGAGERMRIRRCDNPPPLYDGRQCPGAQVEKAVCNIKECPVHGRWGQWGPWQPCSESCGDGTQERYRRCDSPKVQNGGDDCDGSDTDKQPCRISDCQVNGAWGTWQEWSACSLSCGGGSRNRIRNCDSPAPKNGGSFCSGSGRQIDYCNREDCPIHGNWAEWGVWGDCTLNCGGGQRRRFRTCTNPAPKQNGRPCVSSNVETEHCNQHSCKVDGEWGMWGAWSSCSQTCGGGTQQRVRACQRPLFGGEQCLGDRSQVMKCNVGLCKAGFPLRAEAKIIGSINSKKLGISRLVVNITKGGGGTRLSGDLHDVTPEISRYMKHLVSLLSPIYWTTAFEIGKAVNGFTLTHGNFERNIQVNFATGQILKMQQIAHGVDRNGILQLDIVVRGEVPTLPDKARIRVLPYTEDYIQTGPDSLYAYSSRSFQVDGYTLPYAWNHTINYDPQYGTMPYLVQQLATEDIYVDYDVSKQVLRYQLAATIAKGEPSNSCPVGFFLDPSGTYCADINECQDSPTVCDQQCLNMMGGYRCACARGYRLRGRNVCEDINECVEQRPCSHECENVIGSYHCTCPTGYQLLSNGICRDVDECRTSSHDCRTDQQCHNTPGGYQCINQCPQGMEMGTNGTCIDVDECAKGISQCGTDQKCRNIPGGYRCVCPPGYRSRGPGQPCQDINECRRRRRCQHGCQNTAGSFRCTCPSGYRLAPNGRNCQDIDECTELQINCGEEKLCFNRRGDYQCIDTSCPGNYEREPKTGLCVLRCSAADANCIWGSQYADILEFRTVALPSGIQAHQDLIGLKVYDQHNVHLKMTSFKILQNDPSIPFGLRVEDGQGVVSTLRPLEEKQSYRIRVEAKTFDTTRRVIQYQKTFIIFISVSPYRY